MMNNLSWKFKKSEKLTLRVSLRDKAGEIRYTKQILAIETNWIKAEFRF